MIIILSFLSPVIYAKGINVFGIGIYDVKLDGTDTNEAIDIRYEYRFDKTIFDIGPNEDNFFS